jgi:hypothetical protein
MPFPAIQMKIDVHGTRQCDSRGSVVTVSMHQTKGQRELPLAVTSAVAFRSSSCQADVQVHSVEELATGSFLVH